MAELIPHPFGALVTRMFTELETEKSIFDYPQKKFFIGQSGRDYSVKFHGKNSSSPLGPASGPQTQMAQNLVLSWLGGSRIMELKTVQIWMNWKFRVLALICKRSVTMWNGRRSCGLSSRYTNMSKAQC